VGTQVVPSPETALPHTVIVPLGWRSPASAYPAKQTLPLDPYTVANDRLTAALQEKGLFDPNSLPDAGRKFFRSETGQITIDGPQDRLVLDTPRTAGGYAPAGQTVDTTQGGVRFSVEGSDATVWVSALDQNSIRQSRRLLVTHLTDLQNTGIQYAELARQTLLAWGGLPHLVRAGKANLSIRLETPAQYRVWALAPSGKRLAEVPATVEGDLLRFTADVAGDAVAGARMIYEVTRVL
jgi:hypothetical protein